MTGEERLLRAILDEPKACGHIERLAALMAHGSVRIVSGEEEDVAPVIDCQLCEIVISFEEFGKLVIGAAQGRN